MSTISKNYGGLMVLIAGLVSLPGCYLSFQAAEVGSGHRATQTRQIQPFEQLSLAGCGDVTIEFGKPASLELTTDDNLIDLIETVVVDQRLKIKSTKNIDPTIVPEFKITTDNLSEVSIGGSADVAVSNYEGDKLRLELAGAGGFKIDGVCETVILKIAGSGSADLTQLVAKKVEISIAGSGSADVNAVENLSVSIAGSGDIGYIGQPEIKKSVAGSGDVHPIEAESSAPLASDEDQDADDN